MGLLSGNLCHSYIRIQIPFAYSGTKAFYCTERTRKLVGFCLHWFGVLFYHQPQKKKTTLHTCLVHSAISPVSHNPTSQFQFDRGKKTDTNYSSIHIHPSLPPCPLPPTKRGHGTAVDPWRSIFGYTQEEEVQNGNWHSPVTSLICSWALEKHNHHTVEDAEQQALLIGTGNFTYKPQLSPPHCRLPPGTAANWTAAFKSGLWPFAYFLARVTESMENLEVSVLIQTESISVPYRVCSLSSF